MVKVPFTTEELKVNHYGILGIGGSAGQAEIVSAAKSRESGINADYDRQLSRGVSRTEAEGDRARDMRKLLCAVHVLTNEERRAEFDKTSGFSFLGRAVSDAARGITRPRSAEQIRDSVDVVFGPEPGQ